MQIQVNYGDVEVSPTLSEHVIDRVNHALKHRQERVTRVEVHLRDDKSKRKGQSDRRCVMEARLAGCDPLAVTHRGDDIYDTVNRAAEKLARAISHRLGRNGKTNHSH
ncbi:MAG: HPF/RaiA family ribosome-associated protein [Phycisphaeraceae bacterium]|nr:HPF/RaiA family ribosome-associated protein [Phycisphaeraceae bacterium]